MAVGVPITTEVRGLNLAIRRLNELSRVGTDLSDLLEQIGSVVESQTRTRIQSDKKSPMGEAWEEWSEKYSRTRSGTHSLLQSSGSLLDSIQYVVTDNSVEVGSNLVYAATHQFGRDEIPERPYLGLSTDDQDELAEVIEDWVASL